jgi:hypothetical protein
MQPSMSEEHDIASICARLAELEAERSALNPWCAWDGVGSVAFRKFGAEKTRGHTEDQLAANHKCLISRHSSSLRRASPSTSEFELELLSTNATEPYG